MAAPLPLVRTGVACALIAALSTPAGAGGAGSESRPGESLRVAPCGEPGLAACPLQEWMRRALSVPYAQRDYIGLKISLEQLAQLNPSPGDPTWRNWNRLALAGASAAKRSQAGDVVKACAACHVEYRRRYRAEHREHPVE